MDKPQEKIFQIWAEGWQATGDSADASHLGAHAGDSFEAAVRGYVSTLEPAMQTYYNLDKTPPTFWGCRLFDNETDARQAFG